MSQSPFPPSPSHQALSEKERERETQTTNQNPGAGGAELPRSAWKGLPVQHGRQLRGGRAVGAQHDDGPARRARHHLPPVQRGRRLEVRQGVRERREVQGGQVHPRGRAAVQRHVRLAGCLPGPGGGMDGPVDGLKG